jgi:hypothetical protein
MRNYAATQGRQEVELSPGVTIQTAPDVRPTTSKSWVSLYQMEIVTFDNGVFKTSTS